MDDDFFSLTLSSIQIPDSWSPEVACEVADFLGDIAYAIRIVHGSAMAKYLERPRPGARVVEPDDDPPF